MTYTQLQEFLKGKIFLIGLTFIDHEENVIDQYQTHGAVSELTTDGIIRIRRNDNSNFQMPYDPKTITKAEKGEFRLRTTQEVVIDPDFLMTWEIVTNGQNDLEQTKRHGYFPSNEKQNNG